MPFPFYGQDGYLRSTVVNVFDKFCLKLVSRQFIQIKILFLIQLFFLLIGSQLITFQLLEFQFIIHASHDYRHTVATNFYEHGVSIQSIRDYLGHMFEEMTMQYKDYMPRKIAKENDAYFEEEENSLLACMQKGEQNE